MTESAPTTHTTFRARRVRPGVVPNVARYAAPNAGLLV